MRVADYITSALYNAGGKHVFMVTGGMIMHLTDALYQHPDQQFISCHNEQSAVMAADAYGRFTGELGVSYVTAGPGALNTLTGVVGAYVDSSPCIIVSGQSKVSQSSVHTPRQFALQGFNTLPVFKHVTKYAVVLDDISKIRYEVEKCIYIAKSHRVGPVWIELPIDIQSATFDPLDYPGFIPPANSPTHIDISEVTNAILNSKRPCIIAGAGIRLSNAITPLHKLLNKTNIPILTSRLGMDIIDHYHPLFVGRPGTYGDRAANFTIQKSDLILSIGCRLAIGLVGYDYDNFAKNAIKIIVDIDETELCKPSVIPDIAIKADASDFITSLLTDLPTNIPSFTSWIEQTQAWKQKYPVDLPEYINETEGINSYHFTRLLSNVVSDESVFVVDTGSCFHVFAQVFEVKMGQRHIITGGLSTMGYMPAAIGPASLGCETYCITGDGSIQMNLQELQTIVHNKLPIKIIIFNNNGYLLIRHTQNNFMEGRLIGEGPDSGISFPDMKKIAYAYGIDFVRISSLDHIDENLTKLKKHLGPLICEVITPSNQLLIPRVSSKKLDDGTMVSMPYDDMYPFLDSRHYTK